jgi:predicted Zn finger-like uncharacterized protein
MLIVCPSCATSYDVKQANLPPEGRRVRCIRCRTVWHAESSHADKVLAAAAAIAPDRGNAAEPVAASFAAAPNASAPPLQSADEPREAEESADDGSFAATVDGQSGGADEASAQEPSEATETEAPPIAPVDLDAGEPPSDIADRFAQHRAALAEDIESAAARRPPRGATRTGSRWPLSRLQTGILVLVVVDAILVGWRNDIVRALPQTASFYALFGLPVNLRGLTFEGVVTTMEQHEGIPILVVEGSIVNGARKIVEVPRLKFIVRNAARQEIYSWTAVPSRSSLPPGEALGFRTRLASPPPDARDLILRFLTRRDVVAGGR